MPTLILILSVLAGETHSVAKDGDLAFVSTGDGGTIVLGFIADGDLEQKALSYLLTALVVLAGQAATVRCVRRQPGGR